MGPSVTRQLRDDTDANQIKSKLSKPMRHKTLLAYYSPIQTLDSLLSSCLNPSCSTLGLAADSQDHLVRPWVKVTDKKAYTTLLEDTLCCYPFGEARDDLRRKIQASEIENTNISLPLFDQNGSGLGSGSGSGSVDVMTDSNGQRKRQVEGTQQEAIDRILRELGRAAGHGIKGKNVLLSGNRYSAYELPINPVRPHVENRYVHSPASVLRQTNWKLLRSRIGDEAFRLILTHTSMFLPVGNNCYTQLTGEPIYDLYDRSVGTQMSVVPNTIDKENCDGCARGKKRHRKAECVGMRKRVKVDIEPDTRTESTTSADQKPSRPEHLITLPLKGTKRTSAADVILARQRIFYGHPSRLTNGQMAYGLPPNHMIPKLSLSSASSTDFQYLQALRTIFPSMFRNSSAKSSSLSLEDDQIRVRGNPERIEGMLGMIREVTARYSRIDFRKLLDRCVTKETDYYGDRVTNDVPTSSPSSSTPVTQAFPETQSSAGLPGMADTHVPPPLRPVTHRQVCRFMTAVIRQLFSPTIMGSKHNLDTLLSHVRHFVKMKQYETITLHDMMQGLRINEFEWCQILADRVQRVNPEEALKRTRLVEDFIKWAFGDVITNLIKNTFYVTETASTRYETVYYLHNEWQKATAPYFVEVQGKLLTELDRNQAFFARQGELGVSAVRFIPKPTGFRPIVNLGRKIRRPNLPGISTTGHNKVAMTANQILKGVHQVLTFEKDRHKASLGASLFGTNEIFGPLQSLKSELIGKYGRIPRLYLVKMDIKAAFDTIKQNRMIEIVSGMLDKNHDYCLMLYCLLLPPASKASQGSARRLFKSRATVDNHLASSFTDHASDIAQPLRNAVVVDLVRRKQVTRHECLALLKTHIQNNVWQVGKKLYRQKTGIPQGSKISSLLCSFFYAHMENEHLAFTRREGSRLLRYIDDFLFITDDRTIARRFVDTMSRGFPSYGAEISINKTLLSFESQVGGSMGAIVNTGVDGQTLFPYCGFLINTETLDVMSDYPRMMTGPIKQSFALRSTRHRGSNFVGWFSRQLENRNHIAYLNTVHNSPDTVYLNIFLNFALTSMKLPQYFKSSEMTPKRDELIARALSDSIEYTYNAGLARVRHAARKSGHGDASQDHYGVQRAEFTFLAKSAIISVLRRKASRFKGAVDHLEKDLRLNNGKRYSKSQVQERLTRVCEKGWEAVKDARF
ncbi:hypothetical protein IAU59_003188 [Kwoniella sp. CBS 9459]